MGTEDDSTAVFGQRGGDVPRRAASKAVNGSSGVAEGTFVEISTLGSTCTEVPLHTSNIRVV